jgi:hypothetical protein
MVLLEHAVMIAISVTCGWSISLHKRALVVGFKLLPVVGALIVGHKLPPVVGGLRVLTHRRQKVLGKVDDQDKNLLKKREKDECRRDWYVLIMLHSIGFGCIFISHS